MAGFDVDAIHGLDEPFDAIASATEARAVSVVIVSYKTGPLLLRAIESVIAQPETGEIVLVDNGNPPALIEQARLYSEPDRPVRVLSGHGNIGFAAACNLGARAARGPDLLFLNPDAVLPDGAISKFQTVAASASKRPVLIGPRLVGPDGGEQAGSRRRALTPGAALIEASGVWRLAPKKLGDRRFNIHGDPCPEKTSSIHTISGACMYVSREDYFSIGGMDERYFLHVEDIDFCLRLREAGGVVLFEPSVNVTHFKSSSRVSAVRVEARKSQSFTTYFWRHFADKSVKTSLALALVTAAIWGVFGLRALAAAGRRAKLIAGFAARTRGAGLARATRLMVHRLAR